MWCPDDVVRMPATRLRSHPKAQYFKALKLHEKWTHIMSAGEVWNRQKAMDNSGIGQKISFTGRVFERKIDCSKTNALTWLSWQHLAPNLFGKLLFLFFFIGSKSKGKVQGAERSSVYDVRSTQDFVHEGGGGGLNPHPLVRNKSEMHLIRPILAIFQTGLAQTMYRSMMSPPPPPPYPDRPPKKLVK